MHRIITFVLALLFLTQALAGPQVFAGNEVEVNDPAQFAKRGDTTRTKTTTLKSTKTKTITDKKTKTETVKSTKTKTVTDKKTKTETVKSTKTKTSISKTTKTRTLTVCASCSGFLP